MQVHPGWGTQWSVEVPEAPPRTSPTRPARRRGRGRRRRTRRGLVVGLAALVVALAALGGWVALDALRARDALTVAADELGAMRSALSEGDRDGADRALADARAAVEQAVGAVDGVHWTLAGHAPVVGDDVRAVRTMVAVLDDLTADALPPLVAALDVVDPAALLPGGGATDLTGVRAVAPDLVAADAVVTGGLEQLDDNDAGALLTPVADARAELRRGVAELGDATGTAARVAVLLPGMIGDDGPRTYLLLVQNNAELRATGGVPGAVALLHADGGSFTLTDVTAAADLTTGEPVAALDTAEDALFGTLLATDMRDVTFTPDFPRAAEIAATLWAATGRAPVDGVLAVDPGALALLLQGVGPVPVTGPTGPAGPAGPAELVLDADDVVDLLLHDVYQLVDDPAAQDQVFASAAQAVVAAVTDGQADPAATVRALATATGQGRVLLWSADPAEQAQLAGTPLAGELTGTQPGPDGDRPVVGVYLNATAPSKMGYYLDLDEQVVDRVCRPDGSQALTVEVTATSTAPDDLSGLSTYVTGTAESGRAGQVAANVLVYAPTGGRLLSQEVDGQDATVFAQVHDGLPVSAQSIVLGPGESTTLRYEVLSGAHQPGTPVLRTTPTAQDVEPAVVPACRG